MFKLKEFRFDHELLQQEMAEILGCTQSSVSRIEKDGLDLTKAQYEALCEKYGSEEVNKYKIGDVPSKVLFDAEEWARKEKEYIDVIKKQNVCLCDQLQTQQEWLHKYMQLSEKLLSILEKVMDE